MTSDQMALFDRLFEQASALPETERQTWLAMHCADSEVRAELESLLPHAAPAAGFTKIVMAAAELGPLSLSSGHMIGPYRIAGILGEGGMGAVYEGVRDDDQFRHRVAIKVLRGGARSEPLRRRFLQERQILAELEHPNIARLFDGGTAADGSPYLVMERIDGEPLTAFAESRKLSVRPRLELFRQVASAVQYAHQKLIVHRDLKPGNILVTTGPDGRPQPKLLDFGIAKLLDPETGGAEALTATGHHLMTPDYASPEQVQGKPVTAASDIYSLGAVLYELLSGTRPHGLKSYDPAEIAERICLGEVLPPSTTGGAALRGDLDTIVLKAMHKVPERRYNSAEQFSEDLRRFLEGLPVLARPDTAGYRARKFLGRHWVGMGSTAAVIAALTVGIGISMHEAHLAKERFELVRTLSNRFLFDFYGEISSVNGTTKAQGMVVNTAVEYLEKLSRTAGSDRALWRDLAEAYGKLANVQGNQNVSHAGRYDDALVSQRRSVEFYRKLAAADAKARLELGVALVNLAKIEQALERNAISVDHAREGAGVLDGVEASGAAEPTAMYERSRAYLYVARGLYGAENPKDALPSNLTSQQYLLQYLQRTGNVDTFRGRYSRAIYLQDEGKIRMELGDLDGGIAILERVLGMVEGLVVESPANRNLQHLLYQHLDVVGRSYYSLTSFSAEDPRKAIAVQDRCLTIASQLLTADPADEGARANVAMAECEAATPWIELDPQRAIPLAASAQGRYDETLREHPADAYATSRRASACMRLALALARAGRPQDAIQPARESVEGLRALRAKSPSDISSWNAIVFALTISGEVLSGLHRETDAREAFAEAADLAGKLSSREHPPISLTLAAAYAYDHFGEYWKSRGDRLRAREWFERSRQAWAARPEKTPAVDERRRRAEEKLNGLGS